jgi:hypothetical protein
MIKDSGKKTGAHRDDDSDKPKFGLIPYEALVREAKHYEAGANKYGRDNWKNGIPSDVYYESALRHLLAYGAGKTDEDHLAAVKFNVNGIMWNEDHEIVESNEGMTEWGVESCNHCDCGIMKDSDPIADHYTKVVSQCDSCGD